MEREDPTGCEAAIRQACAAARYHDAVALIIEHYGASLLGFLADRVGSRSDAEDVLSEVAITLLDSIHTFEFRSSARAWTYAIARNASIDFHRNPERHPARNARLTAPDAANVAERVRTVTALHLRTEVKHRLRELRRQLPEEDQLILVLRLDRQFSWEEIAAVTLSGRGASVTSVSAETARLRQRFKRAKDMLRVMASREGLLGE